MSFFKSIGDPLYFGEVNSLFNKIALYGQTIDGGVSASNIVYFDGTDWKVATTQNASGIYAGNNIVVTSGYVSGFSGLAVNAWYGKDSSGNLNPYFTSDEQCIGYAISDTELVILLGGLNSYVGQIGLFGGGSDGSNSNVIDYITITSTGNATDFGNLTQARVGLNGCGSSTRGVFGGGTVIDYVTIASAGNATDFGDLSVNRYVVSCGSSTRGLFAGGDDESDIIDYITIANIGNATDFGNLSVARSLYGSCSSPTRGVFGASYYGSTVIDYVTIATTGNATDFGDSSNINRVGACSSNTRGIFGGGYSWDVYENTAIIEYITIATTGNTTSFGDLTQARRYLTACSSPTRGVFGGGYSDGEVYFNTIDYIIIQTTGNATDFGDLSVSRNWLGACSNAHGGLT